MADIISIQRKKQRRKDEDLNDLLNGAVLMMREEQDLIRSNLLFIDHTGLKQIFERKINGEIIKHKLINRGTFLCGIYVSNLLHELASREPSSWWATDYAFSMDPLAVRQGGDVCFMICGVFPQRGNIRLMDITYYHEVGASLYYRFYGLTNKEIGYYMSCQFETMARLVQNCFRNF